MKQRQRKQQPVGARDLPAGDQIQRVRREVVVREHRALGRPRGSRSVDNRCRCISVQRQGRHSSLSACRRFGPCQRLQFPQRDHRLRFGIAHDVPDLAIAIENIDRHENHAELHASQKQLDHVDAVRQMDAEPVARHESPLGQHARQPVTRVLEVAECAALAPAFAAKELQRRLVTPCHERKIKELEKVHRG